MEYLNRVELTGKVGYAKVFKVGDGYLARFTLATDEVLVNKDGSRCVNTTWHTCTAVDNRSSKFDNLEKGAWVHVEGRIRNQRVVDAAGDERTISDIYVTNMMVLEGQK